MEYSISEKEALTKLGIQSFKNIPKEKIMDFFAMIPNMDKEVALNAIKQIPSMTKENLEGFKKYAEYFKETNNSNAENMKSVNATYDLIIEALDKELKNATTFEEKKYYIEQMKDSVDKKSQKDTENKKFIFSNEQLLTLGFGVAVGVVLGFLGGKGANKV